MIQSDVQQMLEASRGMNYTMRYSSRTILRPESVAEHSWHVSFLSLCVANEFSGRWGKDVVDIGKLLSRAILHDLEEYRTGDFLRNVKHKTKERTEFFSAIADEEMREFGLKWCYRIWKNAKDDSIEGRIIKFSDALSVVNYLTEEMVLGNRNAELMIRECMAYIEDVMSKSIDSNHNARLNELFFDIYSATKTDNIRRLNNAF